MRKIKVLVVDDSALMRKYLKQILEEDPKIEVVDTARDGEEAVEKNLSLKPDVIMLDLNMPKMDGLTALQYIMHTSPCPVVVVSSLTQRGALTTFEALELGAVDYVPKPGGTVSLDIKRAAEEIRMKVKAAASAKLTNRSRSSNVTFISARRTRAELKRKISSCDKVVFIGASTGGPKAVETVLSALPADFPAPWSSSSTCPKVSRVASRSVSIGFAPSKLLKRPTGFPSKAVSP